MRNEENQNNCIDYRTLCPVPEEALRLLEESMAAAMEYTVIYRGKKYNTEDEGTYLNLSADSMDEDFIPIRDLSEIDGLADLTKLKTLSLSGNLIEDVRSLAKLKNLESLVLKNNKVRNIAPLGKLTKLKCLMLDDNLIENITPLEKLHNLEVLHLSYNHIKNISPLRGLKNLCELDLSNNDISDIFYVFEMEKLEKLDASYNRITEFNNRRMPVLCKNLKWLSFSNNPLSDMHGLDDLKEIVCLKADGVESMDSYRVQDLEQLETFTMEYVKEFVMCFGWMEMKNLKEIHYEVREFDQNHVREQGMDTDGSKLRVPEGFLYVADNVFQDECWAKKVKSIEIPSSVSAIPKGVFWKCSLLEEVIVSEKNPYYYVKDNTLYEKETGEIIWKKNI